MRRCLRTVRVVFTVCAVSLPLVMLLGCSSSKDAARDRAVTWARDGAEGMRRQMERSTKGKSEQQLIDRVKGVINTGTRSGIGDPRWDEDAVVIDAVYYNHAQSNAGMAYASHTVRLCVTYRATGKGVTVADAPCRPDLIDESKEGGNLDETIKLED